MNKFTVFWFKHRQDVLVALFCMLLIFWGAKNLHDNISIPGRSGLVWVAWMAVVIGASMTLGAALNKIAVREEKTSSQAAKVAKNKNDVPK